jgi:hypothetical protein
VIGETAMFDKYGYFISFTYYPSKRVVTLPFLFFIGYHKRSFTVLICKPYKQSLYKQFSVLKPLPQSKYQNNTKIAFMKLILDVISLTWVKTPNFIQFMP